MYVSETCAEGILVNFPWLVKKKKKKKKVEIRSKIAFFSNERHFEILFSKKRVFATF